MNSQYKRPRQEDSKKCHTTAAVVPTLQEVMAAVKAMHRDVMLVLDLLDPEGGEDTQEDLDSQEE